MLTDEMASVSLLGKLIEVNFVKEIILHSEALPSFARVCNNPHVYTCIIWFDEFIPQMQGRSSNPLGKYIFLLLSSAWV